MELYDLKFSFESPEPIEPYQHYGSTWRGVLGQGLRCVTGEQDAQTAATSGGFYQAFFAEGYQLPRLRAPVMPYTFAVPWHSAPRAETRLSLRMRIVGPATQYLGLITHALQAGAELGFAGKSCLTLRDIAYAHTAGFCPQWHSLSSDTRLPPTLSLWHIPPLPQAPLLLHAYSPLRLKQRQLLINRPEKFNLRALLLSAIRRVNDYRILCDAEPLPPIPPDQMDTLESALLDQHLAWQRWRYWSSREERHGELSGLTGTLTLDLQKHPALWPYVYLGQFSQVGSGASKGLGAYALAHYF